MIKYKIAEMKQKKTCINIRFFVEINLKNKKRYDILQLLIQNENVDFSIFV